MLNPKPKVPRKKRSYMQIIEHSVNNGTIVNAVKRKLVMSNP